jgi:hypothetical protein
MNPLDKIFRCIELCKKRGLSKDNNLASTHTIIKVIDQCIKEGAPLHVYVTYYEFALTHAIWCMCDVEIIKHLKDIWYDKNVTMRIHHSCRKCKEDEITGIREMNLKGNIEVYINNLYDDMRHDEYESRYIRQVADILDIKIISNLKKRHTYFIQHIVK